MVKSLSIIPTVKKRVTWNIWLDSTNSMYDFKWTKILCMIVHLCFIWFNVCLHAPAWWCWWHPTLTLNHAVFDDNSMLQIWHFFSFFLTSRWVFTRLSMLNALLVYRDLYWWQICQISISQNWNWRKLSLTNKGKWHSRKNRYAILLKGSS